MKAHSIDESWIKFSSNMWFDPEDYSGCRKRKHDLIQAVGHWTGGTFKRTHKNVYDVLKQRVPDKLSIHFVITSDGVVYQMADCEKTVCYHASQANNISVGTEICSPGFYNPDMGKETKSIILKVHGNIVKQVCFTDRQLESYLKLCDTMHEKLGIKKQIPGNQLLNNVGSDVFEASDFNGFLEHLHVSHRKVDGGTQLSRKLLESGYVLI